MKLKVDKEKCIGCGACESICPNLFKMGDDGKAEEKKKEISGDEIKCAENAANTCPSEAIELK